MKDKFFTDEERNTLKAIALEEMQELYESLQPVMETLSADPGDAQALKSAEMVFHTVGGSAALAGLKDISAVGVETESLLKKAARPLDADAASKVAAAAERLGELIRGYSA